ncbi:MAG: ATP-binding protein [Chlorobium sp.]|nr:MAG: response regulator [Chlorobium sp.]
MITRKINTHPREKRGNKNSSQATIGQAKDVLHRNLSSYMQHGYAYYRMITDEDNHVDFVYEEVNESYAKLTGLRDVIGKRMTEVRPGLAKSSPMFIEKYARVAETGIPDKFEIFIDTENHWYDVSLFSPQKGYVLSMFDDISARKLAENQLRKLSVAVEQSPAIVVMTDPLGNIEYVNPMFTEVTGYSADEARGQNPRILKSGLMPQSVYEELWRTILSGDVWHGELQNKKKNGELYWDQGVISAIRNKENVITNFVAVKVDISEQKKMFAELIAAKQKAEESDRLKSAFLANISHEIRTPMNGILGFAQLLKSPHLAGEEQAEYIDLIMQSGERMLNLINNLINISRIEAGETMLHVIETPVNELLSDLYAFFKPEIEKKGLRLNCKTGLPDVESIVETDSGKLIQILTNLIQNALKFTSKGEIDFGYNRIGGALEFYVIDTGVGIAPDMKEKIFDRFHQVDNTITRTQEGSGLGLSISKAYVELLGGTIRVESREGWGSEFYFTLPYNPEHPRVILGAVKEPSHPIPQLSALCILIAEDDVISSLLLKKNLTAANINILFAINGEEAVAMVRQHPEINIVLMDIKMPLMNGYEATRLIKELYPNLPVIIQTAFTSKEEEEKAHKAGCDGYITKPINKSELFELIKALLHQ